MKTVFTKFFGLMCWLMAPTLALAQLSGSYTIDPSGSGSSNYSSVAAAASDLLSNGVSGPVTFTIASGTYTGQVSLSQAISGASATNTITFKGKTGNRSDVIIRNTGTYTLYMPSVDYVTFEDVTVQHSGTYGVYLYSGAEHNTFDNVRISYTGSGTGYNIMNYQSEFNTFNDCYVEGGYYGMYLYGWGSTSRTEGCTISNTQFYNNTYSSLFAYYTEDLVMDNMVIDSFSGYYPMYNYQSVATTLANSKIIAPNTGTYWMWYYNNYYGNSSTDTSFVYNNMLQVYAGSYGLYGYYMYNNKWYNNSIDFKGSYGAYIPYPYGSEFVNNNWKAEGSSAYGVYMYDLPAKMDYNNLDWSGSSYWGVLGTYAFTSLTQQQQQYSAYNQNSVDVDPEFDAVSSGDLRTFSSILNNIGTKSWVTKDIDGNGRPATGDTKYDIGCNEYYLSPNDLDVKAIVSPVSVKPNGNNTITANFKNAGSATLTNQSIAFQYSTDSGKTWSSSISYTLSSLAPGKSFNYDLTSSWNPGRTGDFRIHVRISTQVTNDPDNSDEIYVDVCSGLSGTYTVGRPTSDFPTLADALKKLNCGLAGNVRLVLAGGNGGTQATYTQMKFNNLHGTANATLTIDGQHPDSVKITRSSSGFEGVIDLNNCSYLNFTNITIDQPTGTGAGIHVWNNSHHNSLTNSRIVSNNSTSYDNIGIALTGSSYSASTYANSNTFEKNLISGHYYAIRSYSSGGNTSSSNGNVYRDNNITSYYYYGIYNYYCYGTVMDGNQIVNPRYQYNYPMYWYYNSKSEITNNTIGDYYVYSLLCYYENQYSQKDSSSIINNLVNGVSSYTSTTYGYGTYFYNPYNLKIWHNTFVYDAQTPPSSATGTAVGAAFKAYYGYGWDIQNNIFYTPMAISGAAPFFLYNPYSIVAVEGNNYVHPSGIVANIGGSNLSSIAALQSALSGTNQVAYTEPIFFAGNGDFHLSTTKQNLRGTNIGIATDIDGDSRCLFAPSIGADESGYPVPKTRAFFAVDDTVFINSATQFSNQAKKNDPLIHNWFVDGSFVGDPVDLEYKFTSTGSYTVKLISEGCGGVDTFEKTIYVKVPTRAPIADFLASKTVVDVNEAVTFKNITTEGPDSFYWRVDSYYVMGQFGIPEESHNYVSNTDSNSTDPVIEFTNPGVFDVSLYAYNIRGVDSAVKKKLITVRQTADMCGFNDFSTNLIGKLFDEGGPNGSYTGNRSLCTYLIDPCTDEIKLTFNSFNLAPGTVLRIYDGRDNSGTPLHAYDQAFAQGLTGDMTQLSNFKKTLVATSGEVYFEFTSGSTTAPGFEILWEANKINPSAPVVSVNAPDTVCAEVPFMIENLSTGQDADYKWYMDTSNINWFNGPDYEDVDVTHQYDFAGTYYVKMVSENCGGGDSSIFPIVVVAPTSAPNPAFSVDNSRPAIGDAVTFTDLSKLGNFPCVGEWEWTISPSTYSFVSGFNKNSQNPQVLFSDTGCYDVTLKVTNSAGSNSYTMTCAVNAISICIPSVKITGTDVGISRVKVGDIDNTSDINEDGYESFVNGTGTDLEMGAQYDIIIERPSGNTMMNRAVWIDYNRDGNFDNTTEMVASSAADANLSWTGTFTIPTSASIGTTRMRVGVNLGNFKQYGCGPNQFGEFEDYKVNITQDQQPPVIIFIGAKDTTIEQCSNWNDPGAYGWDNVDDSVGLTSSASGVNTTTPGKYTIVYKAEDKTGNEGVGTRTVTVVADYTNPILTLKGNNPMTLEVKDTYTDPGADASDNCGAITAADIVVTGTVDANTLGIYDVSYKVTDAEGNETEVIRTVNVVDTESPTLTIVGNMIDSVEVKTTYTDPGVTVDDNYYTGLTYSVTGTVDVSKLGMYELKYTATDGSGNVSQEMTRTVYVVDRTAPEVTLALGPDTTVQVIVWDKYTREYVDVDDNYSEDANIAITFSGTYLEKFGTGATSELGTFTYIYTATDESNNSTSVTRNIEVVDIEAPTLTFDNGSTVIIPRWTAFDAEAVSTTLDDNFYNKSELTRTVVSNDVDKNSTGTYHVEYEVEDPSGNTQVYVLTVIVVETTQTVGIDQAKINTEIYPNPTSGLLNINVDLPQTEHVTVVIYNNVGQQVMTVANQTTQQVKTSVDLGHLNAGVYFVNIITKSQTVTQKVTITD